MKSRFERSAAINLLPISRRCAIVRFGFVFCYIKGLNMKRILVAALLSAFSLSPVLAESVDMSTITCEQLMSGSGEDAGNLLIWVDGWLAGQADETMLDSETLGAQVEGIAAICQDNPAMSIINAAKQYING
jgi:acid stress chaperone HdeB